MSWPLQTPAAIAERLAAAFEGEFEGTDARSSGTGLGVLAAQLAEELFNVHLHHQRLVQEAFPDRASEDYLIRHADTWGVPRVPATYANGPVYLPGTSGTVPVGTSLVDTATGATFSVTVAGSVSGGTAAVTVRADVAGTAGNRAVGATLSLVSSIDGLSSTATVLDPGLTGGAPVEGVEALRARLLTRIRQPPMGGTAEDYKAWARSASSDVAYVRVAPGWTGKGSVGVIVAMTGPRTPTGAELALVRAAIDANRPVTSDVTVLGATLMPVNHVITLIPDTAATEAAVVAALAAFYLSEAAIAAAIPRSRISEAISGAAGEFSHVLNQPAADPAPGATQIPVLGTVAFGA